MRRSSVFSSFSSSSTFSVTEASSSFLACKSLRSSRYFPNFVSTSNITGIKAAGIAVSQISEYSVSARHSTSWTPAPSEIVCASSASSTNPVESAISTPRCTSVLACTTTGTPSTPKLIGVSEDKNSRSVWAGRNRASGPYSNLGHSPKKFLNFAAACGSSNVKLQRSAEFGAKATSAGALSTARVNCNAVSATTCALSAVIPTDGGTLMNPIGIAATCVVFRPRISPKDTLFFCCCSALDSPVSSLSRALYCATAPKGQTSAVASRIKLARCAARPCLGVDMAGLIVVLGSARGGCGAAATQRVDHCRIGNTRILCRRSQGISPNLIDG